MIERFSSKKLNHVDNIFLTLVNLNIEYMYFENNLENLLTKIENIFIVERNNVADYKDISDKQWDQANKIIDEFERELLILRLAE